MVAIAQLYRLETAAKDFSVEERVQMRREQGNQVVQRIERAGPLARRMRAARTKDTPRPTTETLRPLPDFETLLLGNAKEHGQTTLDLHHCITINAAEGRPHPIARDGHGLVHHDL